MLKRVQQAMVLRESVSEEDDDKFLQDQSLVFMELGYAIEKKYRARRAG